MNHYVGIDIGSTCAKAVVLDSNQTIQTRLLQPTGWSSKDTAQTLLQQLQTAGVDPEQMCCVATGYGRICVPYADKSVTEITCHGQGAYYLFGSANATVIDIGGQDTKIIRLTDAMVKDFSMNDKCAAGTGRFLEVMANLLGITPDELCCLAAAGGNTTISSLCTVFAESEVISLIGSGTAKENIAFAVVDSIIKKVTTQASHLLAPDHPIYLTGGLCECEFIRTSLAKALRQPVQSCPDGRYAGAIGAAMQAWKLSNSTHKVRH